MAQRPQSPPLVNIDDGTPKASAPILPEVDPKKLLTKDRSIGYERADGFLEMTNFKVEISGYVADVTGVVIGYLAQVELEIMDDDASEESRTKEYFLSNKDMSSHQAVINAFKSDAVWIQQTKDPFLPQYLYGLCKAYMKKPREERRKMIPVSVIGKQTTDVWVFNKTIQIDDTGSLIPREAQGYILLDDTSLPVLSGITTIDDGEALQKLILAEKSLLANNFPQGLMTIACVAIGANYDLVVKKFGGCALPVLFGAPQSAKTTALKAALSVVGNTDIVQEMTFKAIMDAVCKTSIPFGWDDCDKSGTMKQVAVALFNQGGTKSYHGRNIPRTFPIMTTNVDGKTLKVLSRWMRIPFETLDPIYRSKTYRDKYQCLEHAMVDASASVGVVTAFIRQKLSAATDGEIDEITDRLVQMADEQELAIDQRALVSYSLLVFVCKMILERVGLAELFIQIEEKMENVVLPSYVDQTSHVSALNSANKGGPSTKELCSNTDKALKNFFASINVSIVQNVATFVNNKIKPSRCGCGEAVAFNVPRLAQHIQNAGIDSVMTDATIRHFVTSKKIGCVGKSTKFWGRTTSSTSAHISRRFLDAEMLSGIDQAFSSLAASTSSSTGKGKAAISPRDVQGTDKGETCSPIDVQGIDKGETNSPIDVQDTDKGETSCTPIDVQGAEKGETYPPIDVQGIEKGETYAPIDVQGSDKRETYPPSYVQATKTDRSLKTKSRKGKGKAQDKLKDALTPSDELPAKRIRKNKTTN